MKGTRSVIRLAVAVMLAALCACAAPDPSAPPCRAEHEAYAAARQAQDEAKEALAALSLASPRSQSPRRGTAHKRRPSLSV